LILLLAFSSVAACSGGDDDEDVASGEVVLYTSMPESIVSRLEGVIERVFPDLGGNYWIPPGGEGAGGITLKVRRGRTADIQRIIAEEIAGGGIRADVIWLAEPSPYETYKTMGLLAPYAPPADAPIDARYIDPDGFYVAGRVISMVVAWNTNLRPEGLSDWPDLKAADLTAFPGPESGAARATIKALTERFGRDFFASLAAVGGVSVASNGAARNGLADGTYEAVAVLDYMARQAMDEGSPVDFAYPASGTVLIPSPIAITADASNPGAAKVFIDYILSESGQEIVVQIGSFYPVRSDVALPPGAPPLETITAFDVDWKALATEAEQIGTLWEDTYGPADASG
jgi:iron(III) transport system substrate-binding protein